jgi:hypothetical protein
MIETMHITLTTLRAFVVALRKTYANALVPQPVKGLHHVTEKRIDRETALKSQARLSYLVPLYKAMHAVVQQAGTGTENGVKHYTKYFENFNALIRKVTPYIHDFDKFFDSDVTKLQVLVPVDGVPVEGWASVPISSLVAQMMQDVEDARLLKQNLARAAEKARKAFLKSLTAEQRGLLTHALDAAKANRSHAIQLDARDLDA